jgi:hypothetical protein
MVISQILVPGIGGAATGCTVPRARDLTTKLQSEAMKTPG